MIVRMGNCEPRKIPLPFPQMEIQPSPPALPLNCGFLFGDWRAFRGRELDDCKRGKLRTAGHDSAFPADGKMTLTPGPPPEL